MLFDFKEYKFILNIVVFLYFYRDKSKSVISIDIFRVINEFKLI